MNLVNLVKTKLFRFLCMLVVLLVALILSIVMFGDLPWLVHMKKLNTVTFINDHSIFTWVYFLRSKSEVFRTFFEFLAFVENQFSMNIITLCIDSSGEYLSTKFQAFLASKGIIHQCPCLATPQ